MSHRRGPVTLAQGRGINAYRAHRGATVRPSQGLTARRLRVFDCRPRDRPTPHKYPPARPRIGATPHRGVGPRRGCAVPASLARPALELRPEVCLTSSLSATSTPLVGRGVERLLEHCRTPGLLSPRTRPQNGQTTIRPGLCAASLSVTGGGLEGSSAGDRGASVETVARASSGLCRRTSRPALGVARAPMSDRVPTLGGMASHSPNADRRSPARQADVRLRMSREEREALHAVAAEEGLSVNEWLIREIIRRRVELGKTA